MREGWTSRSLRQAEGHGATTRTAVPVSESRIRPWTPSRYTSPRAHIRVLWSKEASVLRPNQSRKNEDFRPRGYQEPPRLFVHETVAPPRQPPMVSTSARQNCSQRHWCAGVGTRVCGSLLVSIHCGRDVATS